MLLHPQNLFHSANTIRNLKNTYKQAKYDNKRSGSTLQTSAYFDDFDQVLATRDGIGLQNITHVGVEEEPMSSDWDKMNHQKTTSTTKHLLPTNRIWKISQEVVAPLSFYEN